MTFKSLEPKNKVNIPITLRYMMLFLLLTFLCYEAHELFHHLIGGILCGGFGTMTFTTFEARPQCVSDIAVTLSGPLLSFVIAWFGAYWLKQRKHMLFAYTLIFASYAHLRFPLPLMGSGDEWLVARTYLQEPNSYLAAGILFLLALPPLVIVYRSIANPWRSTVFIASLILPFIILFSINYLDGLISETSTYWVGIPIVFLAANTLAILCFALVGRKTFLPAYQ